MSAAPSNGLAARTARGRRATIVALLVSTLLAVVKVVAGVAGNSYALIADGIESVLDVFSAVVVWGGLRIAARPPDENHPYGHGKAESMSAVVVSLGLLGAATGLAIESVREIRTPHHAPAPYTLLVLLVVIVIKETMHARLVRVGRAVRSTAVEADAWHHRSDALTSAAAFVGISVALLGGRGYESADDWAALAACVVIAFNGVRLLRGAAREIMDEAAPADLERRIRQIALGVDGVRALDKCLTRKSGPGWLVDLHVEVDGGLPVSRGHAIGHDVKDVLLGSDLAILDVLVHIEPWGGAADAPDPAGPGSA